MHYRVTTPPSYEATLEFINDKTGKTQKNVFTLPEKESFEFHILKSDNERRHYLHKYAKRTGLFDQFKEEFLVQ